MSYAVNSANCAQMVRICAQMRGEQAFNPESQRGSVSRHNKLVGVQHKKLILAQTGKANEATVVHSL